MLIVGLNLLPNDDLEKKFKILSNDEILLKNNNAGARATGRKFNFPENIKTNAIIVIKKIIKYFFSLLDILLPKKIYMHIETKNNKTNNFIILNLI